MSFGHPSSACHNLTTEVSRGQWDFRARDIGLWAYTGRLWRRSKPPEQGRVGGRGIAAAIGVEQVRETAALARLALRVPVRPRGTKRRALAPQHDDRRGQQQLDSEYDCG